MQFRKGKLRYRISNILKIAILKHKIKKRQQNCAEFKKYEILSIKFVVPILILALLQGLGKIEKKMFILFKWNVI